MKTLFFYCYLLLLSTNSFAQDELVVIVNPDQDQYFINSCLPQIQEFAKAEQVKLIEQKLSTGLPASITSTPAIIYQSAKGRSVYAGRYQEFATIQNFVRVARVRPQQQALLAKKEVWLTKEGRMQIAAQTKVTTMQGKALSEVEQTSFDKHIREGLTKGMSKYNFQDQVALERTDRIFYLDIYPYLNASGGLSVSIAIFSQFSCIDPVYTNYESPFQGKLTQAAELMAQVGQRFQEVAQEQLKSSKIGDAYTAIASTVPTVKDWESIGLTLPSANDKRFASTKTFEGAFPQQWQVAGEIDEKTPSLQFQFPEPLDRYAGEFEKMKGSLSTTKEGQLSEVLFEVDVKSMTMGMASLDKKVLKSYLFAKKYPKATFTMTSISEHSALDWGNASSMTMMGTLKIMDQTQEVPVQAMITPIVDQDGNPRLLVQASFKANITQGFGIKGPDGPKEASELLLFSMNFLMKPAK